jgi:hypothetical protein
LVASAATFCAFYVFRAFVLQVVFRLKAEAVTMSAIMRWTKNGSNMSRTADLIR